MTALRALFDTSPASFYPGGISVYTRQLAAVRADFAAVGVELLPSGLPAWVEPDGAGGLRHKARVLAWDGYYLPLVLPARARAAGADLIHAPAFRMPLRAPVPIVVTIHDVAPLLFPRLFRRRDIVVLNLYMRLAGRLARRVVTVSEHSRQEIVRLLGVPPERISVTYEAAAASFAPVARQTVAAVLDRLGLRPPYLLCVGNVEPRKNLVRVLEAFALLRRGGLKHTLVLVGKAGPMAAPILAAVERLGIAGSVRLTGFVDQPVLAALYSGAAAFVYPSLYEGFGIPPLEAMACGCPVITSNVSSLPEVVGEAGLQVCPTDVGAIAAAIDRLIGDPAEADRLRQLGAERAQGFTWRRCAEQTAEAYRLAWATPANLHDG